MQLSARIRRKIEKLPDDFLGSFTVHRGRKSWGFDTNTKEHFDGDDDLVDLQPNARLVAPAIPTQLKY